LVDLKFEQVDLKCERANLGCAFDLRAITAEEYSQAVARFAAQ